MSNEPGLTFEVSKENLHETRIVPSLSPDDANLKAGEILFKVDHFALTANNITYAAMGEAMSYWGFFPAEEGWGRVPVWGFGDVVASKHPGVEAGSRYYGYYPMSTFVTVAPAAVSPDGFFDGIEHRKSLHAIYNRYTATANDPIYTKETEALQLLFRPLFTTSFLIDDFLGDNDFFGAEAIILSSASSKTSFGAAHLLAARRSCHIIGVTSAANVHFVEGLGCYDTVVTYDNIDQLDPKTPVAYVDVAGNASVKAQLHNHFQDNMKYSCSVGAAHWDQAGDAGNLPGAKPLMFFAPDQGQKRNQEWGADVFQQRFLAAWHSFLDTAGGWLKIETYSGPEETADVYQATLVGHVAPNIGNIVSLGK
jgi:uncharacterized protein DUF2855